MNGQNGFCNFDYETSGFCQLCSTVYARGDCYSSGIEDEKGQTECKRICTGNKISINFLSILFQYRAPSYNQALKAMYIFSRS